MQTPRRDVVLGKYVFQLGWSGAFPGTQSAKYSNLFVCSIKFTMLPSPDLTKNFIRNDGLKDGEMIFDVQQFCTADVSHYRHYRRWCIFSKGGIKEALKRFLF